MKRAGLYTKVWQSFCVLLPVRTVGVHGDERTYDEVIALRVVDQRRCDDGGLGPLPHDVLQRISSRIIQRGERRQPRASTTLVRSRPPPSSGRAWMPLRRSCTSTPSTCSMARSAARPAFAGARALGMPVVVMTDHGILVLVEFHEEAAPRGVKPIGLRGRRCVGLALREEGAGRMSGADAMNGMLLLATVTVTEPDGAGVEGPSRGSAWTSRASTSICCASAAKA